MIVFLYKTVLEIQKDIGKIGQRLVDGRCWTWKTALFCPAKHGLETCRMNFKKKDSTLLVTSMDLNFFPYLYAN